MGWIFITEEQRKVNIKQAQLVFIIKKNLSGVPYDSNEVDNFIYNMTDTQVEIMFKLFQQEIEQETWVDCNPNYYHITEFEEELKKHIAFYESNERRHGLESLYNQVDNFFKRVKKSSVNDLTLEEKTELLFIVNFIVY